jgi:hypothetical protein
MENTNKNTEYWHGVVRNSVTGNKKIAIKNSTRQGSWVNQSPESEL